MKSTAAADKKGLIRAVEIGLAGLLGLALFAATAKGEELPSAPSVNGAVRQQTPSTPIKRDFHTYMGSRWNRSLFLADFSVRAMDADSTRRFMTNSCKCMHEGDIGPIANTTPGMWAYSLGAAAGIEFASYELWKHHHEKIARVLQVTEVMYDGGISIKNYVNNAEAHGKVVSIGTGQAINPIVGRGKGWSSR
jgi:hypothetical protein